MYEKSVELLNLAIADELSAVHQYMYLHFRCDDQGYDLLSNLFRRTAIEEMMHIERLAERILYLKGEIEIKASMEVQKISEVRKMLDLVCTMEQSAIKMYNRFSIESTSNADSVTKNLFESLLMDEERHFGQFDDEFENIKKHGDNYLALQSIERSKIISNIPPGGQAPN